MRQTLLCLLAAVLAGCATYDGRGLIIGTSGMDDVFRALGTPAQRWVQDDHSVQLVYPRGPFSVHTYMVRIDAQGRLAAIDNALTPATFARIEPGMSDNDVLRLLGPSEPAWTVYYATRDELAWEWRYCDDMHQLARFDVLLDATTRRVRSTLSRSESLTGECGESLFTCWCSR